MMQKSATAKYRSQVAKSTESAAASSKSSMWALWAAVLAAIVAALLIVILGYLLAHHDQAKNLLSSDPTIAHYSN